MTVDWSIPALHTGQLRWPVWSHCSTHASTATPPSAQHTGTVQTWRGGVPAPAVRTCVARVAREKADVPPHAIADKNNLAGCPHDAHLEHARPAVPTQAKHTHAKDGKRYGDVEHAVKSPRSGSNRRQRAQQPQNQPAHMGTSTPPTMLTRTKTSGRTVSRRAGWRTQSKHCTQIAASQAPPTTALSTSRSPALAWRVFCHT